MLFDDYGLVSDEHEHDETTNALIKRIEALEQYISYLHEIIPLKYKKAFPEKGENPFFSTGAFKLPEDSQELAESKKRMLSLFEDNKGSVEANARARERRAKEQTNDKLDQC